MPKDGKNFFYKFNTNLNDCEILYLNLNSKLKNI